VQTLLINVKAKKARYIRYTNKMKCEVNCSHSPGPRTRGKVKVKVKVKVKCALIQALSLCTGRTTHRGSRGIVLSFHDHGIRRG